MRRCYWGLWPHPAKTAVLWFGWYRPACYHHRANIELTIIESRLLIRAFQRSMDRVNAVIATPIERVEEWARELVGR